MTDKKETWAQRARSGNWLLTFELTAIVVAVVGFIFAGIEIREANKERKEASLERIVSLYNIAVHKNTVPAARKMVIEILVSREQSLNGIDLSCRTIGNLKTNEQGEEECIEGANLRFAELQGAELYLADLEGADLEGAKLEGANLAEAKLQGANLSYAKLQGTNLWGAKLQGAELYNAKLQDANLGLANLKGADLRFAKLQGANLWGAKLQNKNLWGAKLQGADLEVAKLQGAILSDADFTDTNIDNADFTDAWAWSDKRPKGLKAKINLCVYDEDKHDRYMKPKPCIAP